ncbi:1-phosphofructokinase family hexose kinase [Nesterenkonia suensis]
MFLTITPNPALDLTYRIDRLQSGSTHRVPQVSRRAGGKGLNVSSVLAALDSRSLALLPLGGAAGDELMCDLHHREVPAEVIPLSGSTRQTLAVVESDGSTTNFSEAGPLVDASEWNLLVRAAARRSRHACAVVISGSLPPGVSGTDLGHLIQAVRGQSQVVVDTSGENLLHAAHARADLLAPNLDELADCLPGSGPLLNARELIRRGAGAVLVSRGRQGFLHVTADAVTHQPAVPGIAGNTTGAGDAALAAYLHRRCQLETDIPEALAAAAAAGASAVLEPVAGVISPTTFRTLLDTVPTSTPGDF